MAFAKFFDRSVTAASQVLQNFNLEDFKAKLSAHVVGLAMDARAVASVEGRATLDLTVRMLARLYPTLVIHPIVPEAQEYAGSLQKLACCRRCKSVLFWRHFRTAPGRQERSLWRVFRRVGVVSATELVADVKIDA